MTETDLGRPKLARAKSGIGSPGGPSTETQLDIISPSALTQAREIFSTSPSEPRKIIIVKCIEYEKVKVPREYLGQKLALGIDDLPESPSSWFLDEFFDSKTFAFFDLRNQGRIVEEVTDTLLRFSSLIPVLVLVVATDGFGRGVEASLRVKTQSG